MKIIVLNLINSSLGLIPLEKKQSTEETNCDISKGENWKQDNIQTLFFLFPFTDFFSLRSDY